MTAMHPPWCLGSEQTGKPHRSETLSACVPDSAIDIRVWASQEADSGFWWVKLDVEEADFERRVWSLDGGLARRLADVAGRIDYLAMDRLAEPEGRAAHPIWCTREEEPGRAHRSADIAASQDGDLIGVWMFLNESLTDDEEERLTAWIMFREDEYTRTWPLNTRQLPLLRYALTQAALWRPVEREPLVASH